MSANPETGLRFNAGKPELSMILEAINALTGGARVLTKGAVKYSRGNWLKGLSHTQIADSLLRHLMAWLNGEDVDPETGEYHVDHVFVNALFLAEMRVRRPDLDDRNKPTPPPLIQAPSTGPLAGIDMNAFTKQFLDKTRTMKPGSWSGGGIIMNESNEDFNIKYSHLEDLAERCGL